MVVFTIFSFMFPDSLCNGAEQRYIATISKIIMQLSKPSTLSPERQVMHRYPPIHSIIPPIRPYIDMYLQHRLFHEQAR
ncbi:hypothetical protein GGR55DRAFT_439786 [Xylaria sp. FL0064]|nr:hypothetical protein GGR55DRAFT_439786 [Xylaria sp. FL0064]